MKEGKPCQANEVGGEGISQRDSNANHKSGMSAVVQAAGESDAGLDWQMTQWPTLKYRRFQSQEDVHSSILDGEAVLLNLENGMYYSLNRVGTMIWELCDGAHTLADILEKVCENFEVEEEQAKHDLLAISSELLQQKLLIPTTK
jgi:hypothetical protein